MAFTAEDMIATYLYRDEDLNEATSQVRIPTATTFADAETFAVDNLLPLLNDLSDATPFGVNIIQRRNRTGASVDGAGEGEKKGIFLIINDARGQPTTKVAVPGIDRLLLKGDYKTIDQENTDVIALLNAIIGGKQADGTTDIVAGITGCVSRRGNNFVSSSSLPDTYRAKASYKYHVASGKGSSRRSS